MDFWASVGVEIVGGFVTGLVLGIGATFFAATQQVKSHDGHVADLVEDTRRWFRDRAARLDVEVQQFIGDLTQRGLVHSGAWLQGISTRRQHVLHEYRDEISTKRRRYRELWQAEGVPHRIVRKRLGPFAALALTDEQRATLAAWRSDVVASHVPGATGAVDDPTSTGREPDLRRFESEGDRPAGRQFRRGSGRNRR